MRTRLSGYRDGAQLAGSAPNSMTLLTHSQNLNTQLAAINTRDAQLRTARQAIKALIETAREDMTKVDQATDLIYGPDGAQKINLILPRSDSFWLKTYACERRACYNQVVKDGIKR